MDKTVSLHQFKNNKSIILNCGYGKGYSVKDIVNIFKKIKKNVIIKYQKRRAGDIAQVYADTKKFKKYFLWKPKFNNLKFILKTALEFVKRNYVDTNSKEIMEF